MRTKLVLAGKSKEEIKESVKAAIEKKELPDLEAGAMSYMMSKDAYLTDAGSHNMAHLMFYMPLGTVWGANLVDSSIMCQNRSRDLHSYWLQRTKATLNPCICS